MRPRGRSDRPLIGVVSRLDYQKGLDLAIPAVEARLERAQFVALGTGDPALTEKLASLERRHAGKVHFHRQFDEPFAHRVYAASDLFLMPSRFEPCGLGQMIAMRYGAVPVAALTGGLVDTVLEAPIGARAANGFVCAPNDAVDLGRALDRALDARRKPDWPGRVAAAMAGDFSWSAVVAVRPSLGGEKSLPPRRQRNSLCPSGTARCRSPPPLVGHVAQQSPVLLVLMLCAALPPLTSAGPAPRAAQPSIFVY